MSKSQRRPQANKGRQNKVLKSGNVDYVQAVQGLRRSNAAQPHVPATQYKRKTRDNQIPGVE